MWSLNQFSGLPLQCIEPLSAPACAVLVLSAPLTKRLTCLTCLVSVCLLVFLSFQETACILLLFKELMATFFRHGSCVSLYRLILLSCYDQLKNYQGKPEEALSLTCLVRVSKPTSKPTTNMLRHGSCVSLVYFLSSDFTLLLSYC